ncbi:MULTISPECIES: TonB-dependent receptor [Pedobacter]|uniref:TonB-dependent receptor n=1 Tax=Pedobacter TaxID=84567 RepID=UPI00292CE583|nr:MULTISPECIES: TonB-dependent receptor [Pedobacter]
MKLIVILLTASFLQVSASGYAQKINISVKDASLKSIFKKLRKQSNYNFLYDSDMLDRANPVSLSLQNAPVSEVLEKCFENQLLTYTINQNTVIVKLRPIPAAREVTVKGKVSDQAGVGLPGVTIKVKGSNTGTVTATDGSFSLKLNDADAVLIFSYLGFASQEVELNGRSELNIVLLAQPSALDEVVVIGYGTQRKGDITGAISSVSADKLKDQSVVNLQGALQGKTAGVQITQNSGAPGAVAQVRIRGLTSINNSDPLYVVDGIPLTSNDINIIDPANIESIDILKDASAQAIYGSRGANGVILVKTKKGRDGEALITLSSYQGVTQVRKTLDMVSASDYVMLNNEAYTNAGRTSPFEGPPSSYTSTTDWQKELFRTARMQNYNVAISGGSKNSTYRVSGGYLDQDGTIIGSDYKRVNLSNNLTFNPKPGLEFGESLAFNKSRSHNVATDFGANIVNDALALDPTIPVKDANGNFTATKYSDIINPLARIHYISDNNPYNQYGLLGSVYAQFKPIKGLTLKSSYSVDLKFSDNKRFTPSYNVAPNFNNPNPSVYQQKDQATNWTWDNTVAYEFTLNKDHHFDLLGGISAQQFTYNYLNGSNQGQPGNDPYLQYLDGGISNQVVGGSQQRWDLLSYLSRLNYNYSGKYFLTATFRRDGSSKFGANNKYGNFPSGSVGWLLTNESFFPKNNVLGYLKLRGGWGVVGNQAPVGYYDYSARVNTSYYAFGIPATSQPTAGPGGLENPDLKWEQVKQWNAGFDYRLFGDHVSGSFDYYDKTTKDMLLNLNILSVSGFTQSPPRNAGVMQNSGIEFSMDYNGKLNDDLNLDAGFFFATIKNRVLELNQTGIKLYSGNIKPGQTELTQVGQSVASFYGYVADGIFQNQQEVDSHARQQTGTAPGDIRFADLNGDGVIDQNDQTFLGSPIPKLTYGFNIGASYKGFDFKAFFSGVYGNKINAAYKYYTDGFFISNYNMETEALGRWTGPGTSNTLPRLIASDPNNNSRVSSFYLQSGSYLRLQNVVLGYTLPKTVLDKLNIKNLRFYLSAQNLLTFTKYTGYDPEVGQQYSGAGGTRDIGIDGGNYPQSRTISAGLNLSF